MKLTLRKASKLVNKIDKKLREMCGEASASTNFRLSIHEPVEQSVKRVEGATETAAELLVDIERLMMVRSDMRKLIGASNACTNLGDTSSINELVSNLAELQQKIGFFAGFVANAVAKVDRETLRVRITTLAAAERAYVNTVDAGSLSQDALDGLKVQIEAWEHQIEEIHDRLEYLNTHNAVDVDEAHEAFLRELGILR
jgi:hypothetical protein